MLASSYSSHKKLVIKCSKHSRSTLSQDDHQKLQAFFKQDNDTSFFNKATVRTIGLNVRVAKLIAMSQGWDIQYSFTKSMVGSALEATFVILIPVAAPKLPTKPKKQIIGQSSGFTAGDGPNGFATAGLENVSYNSSESRNNSS